MDVRFEPLWGHAHLAPVLAEWHHTEFGHLYDPLVWNREIATLEFEAMSRTSSPDITWLAFEGDRPDADTVLGSVSLIGSDDLPGFEHLTPWLASLFVAPRARGAGLGSRLVDLVIEQAAELGHPYVHLFTAGQAQFYLDRGWRPVADHVHRGHRAFVMARATAARGARRARSSKWCTDPDTQGAYSYLRIGGRPADRARLAQQILPGVWFAGEATSVEHPATMHGAWFSGERAAAAVVAETDGDVIVIGAGLAGLSAARALAASGRHVTVLESTDHAGGRVLTDTSLGIPLPLGAAWLHGHIGHPLASFVSTIADDWGAGINFVVGHGPITREQQDRVEQLRHELVEVLAAASPETSAADALAAALDAQGAMDPIVRACVSAWFTVEVENLYAAPMDDFAPAVGYEPYELPGDDCLITSSLAPVIEQLTQGLDIRYERPVRRLTAGSVESGGRCWTTDVGESARAVIVTVPVSAVASRRIEFEPDLPEDVSTALRHIGTGPVVKVFATYDTRWWPTARPIRVVGSDQLRQAVDMTALTAVPTLCWFATGDVAASIELMSEHELCLLVDRVSAECGLTDWT
jgi:monoamine oxidase/GNAT superfamily N-acetyltransferase